MKTSTLIAGLVGGLLVAGGGTYLAIYGVPHPLPVGAPASRDAGPAPSPTPQALPAPSAGTPGAAPGAEASGAAAPGAAPLAKSSACLRPGPAPVPPDGGAASAADMKLGHDVIQAYVQLLEGYQACENARADQAPAGTPDAQKNAWIAEGNSAVDEAHAMADAFAVELKRYHARHP